MKTIEVSYKNEVGVVTKRYIVLSRIEMLQEGKNLPDPFEEHERVTMIFCDNDMYGCDQTIDEVKARMEAAE